MNIEGKVAIITGASRGIGRQLALALASRGVKVVAAARTVDPHRRKPGTVTETVEAIRAAGGDAVAVQADVTKVEDLERLVATAVSQFGGLDIVLNNAASTDVTSAPIEQFPRDAWLREFETNLHAPFTLIALAASHLQQRGGGTIINFTSPAGDTRKFDPAAAATHFKVGNLLGYAASKAALNRLTNALAPEMAAHNIVVLALDPGFTRTEGVAAMGEAGHLDADQAHSMQVPVNAVLQILSDPQPLKYAGELVRAADLVAPA
jgi:NAD(P)-dependent dehydrogenase (short-subunit alcohol dehydrogenase family)